MKKKEFNISINELKDEISENLNEINDKIEKNKKENELRLNLDKIKNIRVNYENNLIEEKNKRQEFIYIIIDMMNDTIINLNK